MPDALTREVQAYTDVELRQAIEAIVGNPKRAGSRARRFDMAESLALSALMAEEARRVRSAPEPREGLLMVYDWHGQYRGCIGVEAWERLLAGGAANSRPKEPT